MIKRRPTLIFERQAKKRKRNRPVSACRTKIPGCRDGNSATGRKKRNRSCYRRLLACPRMRGRRWKSTERSGTAVPAFARVFPRTIISARAGPEFEITIRTVADDNENAPPRSGNGRYSIIARFSSGPLPASNSQPPARVHYINSQRRRRCSFLCRPRETRKRRPPTAHWPAICRNNSPTLVGETAAATTTLRGIKKLSQVPETGIFY